MIKLDTEAEREDVVNSFRALLTHPGWKLVVDVIQGNIDVLRKQLEEGDEDETVETIKLLRNKIKHLEEMKNTPQMMIDNLTSEDVEPENPDPYETKEDIAKRKKETVDKEDDK